ncbi:5652_t:CDS:2 [Entrophospora sp. SA101]|nr:5652_t:CDS:2 [Entrophospora sp. SA101]
MSSYETILASEIFTPLLDFLRNESLDQITISRIFYQQWSLFKIQTEDADCEYLERLLIKIESEDITDDRKKHLKSLRENKLIRYNRKELMSLVDAGLLREKFKEQVDWKNTASSNISILREAIKKLCEIDIDDLTHDDLLCNGIVDLGSDRFQIPESEYNDLIKEKACIRTLNKNTLIKNICADFVEKRDELHRLYKFVLSTKEAVTHSRWIEQEQDRERIARVITDVLLQEIRFNALRKISRGAERQSKASKNRKVKQSIGSRGDKPDLMIRSYHRQKWEEIVYFESGKWKSNDNKILDDHNKLAQFCLDGYDEIEKKCITEVLYKNYMGFGVNVAGEYLVIHGLAREGGVKYYLPVSKAKIPLNMESVEEVEEFIHALLTLRFSDEKQEE